MNIDKTGKVRIKRKKSECESAEKMEKQPQPPSRTMFHQLCTDVCLADV